MRGVHAEASWSSLRNHQKTCLDYLKPSEKHCVETDPLLKMGNSFPNFCTKYTALMVDVGSPVWNDNCLSSFVPNQEFAILDWLPAPLWRMPSKKCVLQSLKLRWGLHSGLWMDSANTAFVLDSVVSAGVALYGFLLYFNTFFLNL